MMLPAGRVVFLSPATHRRLLEHTGAAQAAEGGLIAAARLSRDNWLHRRRETRW